MLVKHSYLHLFLIIVLVWSPCYGADPCMIKLDINLETANNDANTQVGFTPFTLANSGSEVNGVAIDFSGDIESRRRTEPCGVWAGTPPKYYPRAGERIYRDFIFGVQPSGVTITLWGLGANRACDINIFAYDYESTAGDGNRVANWYANGTYIFDTNFKGGAAGLPRYEAQYPQDLYKYSFSGTATTDYLGRIVLTSSRDPLSPADQNFAFVNALIVVPKGTYVPTKYAQHPVPFDSGEDVPIDVIPAWKKSVYADKHDVYFGTDEAKVTDANRNIPLGVLVSQNHSTTTYDPPDFLDFNTTYYWRIDEVNAAPDYTIFKGEVWSFTTSPYFVVDNFNSYANDAAMRSVWKNGSTSAEVSVETTIVRDGNSMRYLYKNNLSPYYSEAYADIADLGIDDPDWLGTGAEALVLRFHVEPNNPFSEQMYVKLTDGDIPAKTATVMYSDTTNVRLKQWNEWSIALTEFTDVNLANVARITIGFGDAGPGTADTVYFEDITLGKEVEELPEVTGEANFNIVHQQLEGFGGSACYDTVVLANHPSPSREEVYDLLFRDLGLDVLRIKNTYDINSSQIAATGQIVAAARQTTRNPNLKLLLVPWSPPTYLKNPEALNGGTLKGGPSNYVYDDYATWWLNSLTGSGGFNSVGIYPDYISIQNEPDWGTQDQACRFNPTENSDYAGYDQAFEAVYNKIDGNVSPMPKMLAPETMGFGGSQTYINALVNIGQIDHVYGFSHHLYSDGSYDYPDNMILNMQNYATNYGYKPLFQTEYAATPTPIFAHAVLLAQHIHNCLVYEGVTSYYHWTLFRDGGYATGGMVLLTPGGGYSVRDIYWFFKHYAYFTDPNWYRADATSSPSSDLRMTAFKNPDSNQLTVVILNKSASSTDLMLTLNGFTPSSSEIYRSSEAEHWLYLGPYSPSMTLPAYSITTIHLTGTTPVFPDCDAVQDANYGLTSDISGDCYVNYEDLEIITDNWLRTDCTEPENCEGADFEPTDGDVDLFDFSRFAEQWMWCNDPEDSGCVHNW
jgi:glucuronoarabinoxylan endo-1,4-beta-xylanase